MANHLKIAKMRERSCPNCNKQVKYEIYIVETCEKCDSTEIVAIKDLPIGDTTHTSILVKHRFAP